jgi:hypothetical protein
MSVWLLQVLVGGILDSIRVLMQLSSRGWIESKFMSHLSLITCEIVF